MQAGTKSKPLTRCYVRAASKVQSLQRLVPASAWYDSSRKKLQYRTRSTWRSSRATVSTNRRRRKITTVIVWPTAIIKRILPRRPAAVARRRLIRRLVVTPEVVTRCPTDTRRLRIKRQVLCLTASAVITVIIRLTSAEADRRRPTVYSPLRWPRVVKANVHRTTPLRTPPATSRYQAIRICPRLFEIFDHFDQNGDQQ